MAVESMEKCRRDSLWTKMLIMISKSEDQSTEDKKKKKSDTEDSRGVGQSHFFHKYLQQIPFENIWPIADKEE